MVLVPQEAQAGVVAESRAAPSLPLPAQVMWFVVVGDGQQRMGAEAVAAAIAAGTIAADTLMWCKGMAEWKTAAEIEPWSTSIAHAQAGPGRTATPAYAHPEPAGLAPLRTDAPAGASQVAGVASVFRASISPPDQSQVAVALPVIRAPVLDTSARSAKGLQRLEPSSRERSEDARAVQDRAGAPDRQSGDRPRTLVDAKPLEPRSGAGRSVPRPELRNTRSDDRADALDAQSRWSPATDTWQGPKVTRRVHEGERQQLLQQVADDAALERLKALQARAERQADEADADAQVARAEARSWRLFAATAAVIAFVAACFAVYAGVRVHVLEGELQARPGVSVAK